MKEQDQIPAGKLKRGGIVGQTAAKAGFKKVGHLAKKPFLSKEKRETASLRNDEEIASMIFAALSKLRGTALKAAQLVAMEMDVIPEVYRLELQKSASQVPPINRALIRKIVRTELLGKLAEFARFEPTPFAAASLGQVHAAVTTKGEELAVKVQYPGIAEGVKSDIAMLKALLMPTKYRRIFDSCFEEMQNKIEEELDYEQEAQNTNLFAKNLKMEQVKVPGIRQDLTTKHIISTTRIAGVHLEEWLSTHPSQKQRDHFGQLLVDLFHHSLFTLRVIHADPNPGNYLFQEDGVLGLIDFGCIKKLETPFADAFVSLISNPNINLKTLETLHGALGIHYRSAAGGKAFDAFMPKWLEWIARPYRTKTFDFAANADYFKEGRQMGPELSKFIDHYDGSFIYFGRAEHGLLRLLERLGAKVCMNSI